jgi:hypothetical protein
MEPQDDPEKRIRDLERPLADTARASEFSSESGGAPYSGQTYPPPPPPGPVPPPQAPRPYNYGGPYPGVSPKPAGGNRLRWILGTMIVIGVLALAGGIAAFAAHQLSGVKSIISSSVPSTTQITSSPQSSPRSPTPPGRTATPTAGPSTVPLPPLGGQLSVSGINENKTIACNDSVVTVSGISNTIVIVGHCASLTVSGMQNSITVDAADTIDASGISNQVTFRSGSPQISKSGDGNVVQQG